jgi:23S rRNA (cytidine1920-2'-O)/16S rRNA (cytidine1409-2'-O)-methyltransferase
MLPRPRADRRYPRHVGLGAPPRQPSRQETSGAPRAERDVVASARYPPGVARPKKVRLDELLVERGELATLKVAQGWILAGKVRVNDRIVTKPGTPIGADDQVVLRAPVEKYVSRGGLKLEAALARFGLEAAGRVVLDVGASTGGFTDCWLQHGAARVYAVDVGHGQLRGSLAVDPRVVSLERTNVSDLSRTTFDVPVELASFDLSYLSTTKAGPIVAALFERPVSIVALIKPLYEGLSQAGKADVAEIDGRVAHVIDTLAAEGLEVRALMASPILGGHGAIELLAHLVSGTAVHPALRASAMAEARALEVGAEA